MKKKPSVKLNITAPIILKDGPLDGTVVRFSSELGLPPFILFPDKPIDVPEKTDPHFIDDLHSKRGKILRYGYWSQRQFFIEKTKTEENGFEFIFDEEERLVQQLPVKLKS